MPAFRTAHSADRKHEASIASARSRGLSAVPRQLSRLGNRLSVAARQAGFVAHAGNLLTKHKMPAIDTSRTPVTA